LLELFSIRKKLPCHKPFSMAAMCLFAYLLVVLPLSVSGTNNLHSDRSHQAVVRRESGDVEIRSTGAMVMQEDASPSRHHDSPADGGKGDACLKNYVRGDITTHNCSSPDTQDMEEDPDKCEAAAKRFCPLAAGEVNFSCIAEPFLVPEAGFHNYTKRCSIDETTLKWRFNNFGGIPANPQGTPVCSEQQYLNGTADGNDCGSAAYAQIDNQDDCKIMANCRSLTGNSQFEVVDTTLQTQTPKGCHIGTDGLVAFNPIATAPTSGMQGTPICELTVGIFNGHGTPLGATAAPTVAPA